ncbi:hypothetical protein [Arcobacter sp. LA11]|uniref:hypothetical protein n=1 Tax=Arcobacter sp. LA11 TaxID=1898176 RepID=UPI000932BF93|nr:hypothetical protein [Arcobacter sp. LA11]
MKKSTTLISQIILVLSLVSGYFLIDFKVLQKKIQGEGQFVEQNKDCNLRKGPCEVIIEDGSKVILEVFPRNIPIMEKIKFKVRSSDSSIKDLSLKIYATNMNMGTVELPLEKQTDGSFEVSSTLPACKIGGMHWNAEVQKSSLFNITGARFQF